MAACEATDSLTTACPPSSPHDPDSTSSSEREDASCPSTVRVPQKRLYGSRLGNSFAQKRWNSFGRSPSSRIASAVRSRLGAALGRVRLSCVSALLARVQTPVHASLQCPFMLRTHGRQPLSACVPTRFALAASACHVRLPPAP